MAYADLADYIKEELGYNESVLQRARKSLGERVVDTVGAKAPGNEWALAGEDGP